MAGVREKDIFPHGPNTMADDDSDTELGGAIDLTKKAAFKNLDAADQVKALSENTGDTTQTITVYGTQPSGANINEGIDLNGLTPVLSTATFRWIHRVVKGASCVGGVAVVKDAPTYVGTAAAGGSDFIQLAIKNINNAAAVDKTGGKVGIPVTAHGFATGDTVDITGSTNYDGHYTVDATSTTNEVVITATYAAETFTGNEFIGAPQTANALLNMVLRATGGTGSGQIRDCVAYNPADGKMHIRDLSGADFDNTTTFEIYYGVFMDKAVSEIMEVWSAVIDAAADPVGGSMKKVVQAICFKNRHATLDFKNNKVSEVLVGIEAGATTKNIDAAAAVNKGNGKVGIPVTAHGFDVGEIVEINGTANYDEFYVVIGPDTSTNEVVIEATYQAETFSATDTIRSGNAAFAIEDALDDNGTNGVGNNRYVPPSSGLTADGFSSLEKTVPNSGVLSAGSYIKVWVMVVLAPGQAAAYTDYTLQCSGQSAAA